MLDSLVIEEWIICKGQSDVSWKEVTINIRWHVFKCKNKQILTYYKWKHHIKRFNEFGDGMHLFVVHDRTPITMINLNRICFLYAFELYQQFDEDKWKLVWYVYWYPKSDIVFLNIIFNKIWVDNEAVIISDWKFIVINKILTDKDIIKWKLESMILSESIEEVVSFIFWLILCYGYVDENNWILNAIKINIPMLGSLTYFNDIFTGLLDMLAKHWIYLKMDVIQRKIWYTIQIIIVDPELLDIYKDWLNKFAWYSIQKNSKKEYQQKIVPNIGIKWVLKVLIK